MIDQPSSINKPPAVWSINNQRSTINPLAQAPFDQPSTINNQPSTIKVLLFRGRGLLSAFIRWQTGSRYSHAAALVDDTWLYEAWQGAGVRVKRFDWSDTTNIDFFEIADLTPDQAARMLDYLKSRVGNKYDYWGVLRFVTRARPKTNNADFCSEYVYSAAEYAGSPLLARTEPAEVSPGLLARSPLLRQVSAYGVPALAGLPSEISNVNCEIPGAHSSLELVGHTSVHWSFFGAWNLEFGTYFRVPSVFDFSIPQL